MLVMLHFRSALMACVDLSVLFQTWLNLETPVYNSCSAYRDYLRYIDILLFLHLNMYRKST